MKLKTPDRCPVCGEELVVTRLTCDSCKTELSGQFPKCRYCALDERLSEYLETFLRCQGNIKEIERTMGISYPTVKNLTEELLNALGLVPVGGDKKPQPMSVAEVLDKLEAGEISSKEASELLAKIKKR